MVDVSTSRDTESLEVRPAKRSDAAAACRVVCRSIAELCREDHRDDPAMLAEWLGNKTPENFEAWIESAAHVALVAERDRQIVGFSLLDLGGTIALLYVDPDARLSGVSKALLRETERRARAAGIRELKLESTVTARGFYERAGYALSGDAAQGCAPASCQAMSRRINSGDGEPR